ncbi:hypothetical protein BGY98DRAFT_936350 [Russula aff. rugulosa BPL654]|nr:hypothetical protein BGY98DRAFT_936350 [Russula aff. rugulosa BPL654]
MPRHLPVVLLLRKLAQQMIFAILFCIRAIIVSFVWLAILPWVTVWTWRVYFAMGNSTAWWISARLRSPSSSPSSFFIYNLTSRSQFNSTATNTTRRSSNETDESLFRTVILGCLGREITVAVSLVNCVASVVDYEVCSPEDTEVMVVVDGKDVKRSYIPTSSRLPKAAVVSPTHPSAQNDVGRLPRSTDCKCPGRRHWGVVFGDAVLLFYSNGVEQLGTESAKKCLRWVSAIWEVPNCSVTVPNRSEAQSPSGSAYDTVDGEHEHTPRFCHVWLAFYHIPPTHGERSLSV